MEALGNLPPDVEPKVSEHIDEIVAMIEQLIDSGNAYAVEGDVYFAVASFAAYGALSARNLDDLQAGRAGRGRPAQAQSPGLRPVEGRQAGRDRLGQPLGQGPARLAHRVLGHEQPLPGRDASTSTAAAWT